MAEQPPPGALFKPFLPKIADGQPLSQEEASAAFSLLMSGQASPAQTGAFLMGLRVRGETVGEICGAVSVMRAKMLPVDAPANAVDVVGTGGDGSGSYNVSTCAAFIVAGCGVPVAKHGNRALSSRSGAADVLAALGVHLDLDPARISACIHKANIGFMFAPNHHSAMKHVGPARQEMGVRTIFNLLGPLSNPAGVKRQMVGVFARHWLEPLAEVLRSLGSEHVLMVHGADGLDEITLTRETYAVEMKNGTLRSFTITPEEFGLTRVAPEALQGGSAEENAAALLTVLHNKESAYKDIALLNASAALVVAGRVEDIAQGLEMARQSLASGAALGALEALKTLSQEGAA